MYLRLKGHLSAQSIGLLWNEVLERVQQEQKPLIIIDARDVSYCDGAGIGLLTEINRQQHLKGQHCNVINLKEDFQKLLDVFLEDPAFSPAPRPKERVNIFEGVGESFYFFIEHIYQQIVFLGELSVHFLRALRDPLRYFRWTDVWRVVEEGGVQALFIILMINFLMGLIMAFQAAIPMRQFGADIFVANLVALSILRVLGPLMTAIVLAGRTGSAFAAEIGTMKVNEEINALKTMGLNPLKFLVTNRILGMIILAPVLTIFADFAGLLGGAVVVRSFGYPLITYVNQILGAVHLNDFLGGFIKSFVFGFIIASIGCYRGLETGSGASAVGQSTTRAVVSSLILIILAEGAFSIVYYFLGI
ncbi:MAG: MlaE family lipid ABC transporter permease subunit [Candidatus Omnitrophica bacterium]|nr:MlaE family lipid ABC transporter permease subunit [Candidatus Omnitrophota bacterium]